MTSPAWKRTLPACLLLLRADFAAAAGGEDWYKKAWEFAAVESAMLMAMIMITIAFDLVWHRLVHFAEKNTYKYGGLNHGCLVTQHKQLYVVLLNRMGGEFMSLGVLALLVFIVEKNGIFNAMAKMNSDCKSVERCLHLPTTGLDWFHMAEIVHFSLFGGMCLYFIQMLCFVCGSVREIRRWEQTQRMDVDPVNALSPMDRQVSEPTALGNLPDHEQYHCMQDRFIYGVLDWKTSDKAKFDLLCRTLQLDAGEDNIDELIDKKFRDDNFNFSAYLALNVEEAVDDAIEVHIISWFTVWLFLAISFPLHRYYGLTFSMTTLVEIVVPTTIWLGICLWVFRRQQTSLAQVSNSMQSCNSLLSESSVSDETFEALECEDDHNTIDRVPSVSNIPVFDYVLFTGHHLMRFAQVVGFVHSYVIARQAFEPPDWEDSFEIALANMIVMSVFWLVMLLWFYYHAPVFLALMSLPPHNSKTTEEKFWALLRPMDDGEQENGSDATLRSTSDALRLRAESARAPRTLVE